MCALPLSVLYTHTKSLSHSHTSININIRFHNRSNLHLHAKLLQWLVASGHAYSVDETSRAGYGGHLHVLKWLREGGHTVRWYMPELIGSAVAGTKESESGGICVGVFVFLKCGSMRVLDVICNGYVKYTCTC